MNKPNSIKTSSMGNLVENSFGVHGDIVTHVYNKVIKQVEHMRTAVGILIWIQLRCRIIEELDEQK